MTQTDLLADLLAGLSREQLLALKAMKDAGVKTPTQQLNALVMGQMGVVEHSETSFYIPETSKPIIFEPHQKIVLNIAAGTHNYPTLLKYYNTIEYTAPKKHGKTATSGAYAKWRTESPVLYDEILFFANDETQSRGRAYQSILYAIKLNPLWDEKKRVLLDKDGNVVWVVLEDYLEHVPTHTKVRAVNVDYRGEAGSNPSLTVWTEAWGYDTEKQEKLFDEMTPVLTREHSQRFVEGYAGYTGKSLVQEKVETLLTNPDKGGRQLTLSDIPDWPWPDEELLPLWVNDQAGIFGYLERGEIARRRMPWLQGVEGDRYYEQQRLTLHDPAQYDRLHLNYWISPVDAFIDIAWWRQCQDASIEELKPWREPINVTEVPEIGDYAALEKYMDPSNWRQVGEATPIVLTGDASVSGDCTALIGTSRHPMRHQDVCLRMGWKWDPPRGSKIDYDLTPNVVTGLSFKQQLIKTCMEYNVVEFGYDEWQLHHLTNELRRGAVVWCRAFKQGVERDVADKQLYDLIKLKRIGYAGSGVVPESTLCLGDIERHISMASRTMKAKEDTKLHIVKANSDSKIDLVVALSMACAETLRLDL